jgi:hypothetical protein
MSGVVCALCFRQTTSATSPICDDVKCPGRTRFKPALPPSDALRNLLAAMSRCGKCDNGIDQNWNYCAFCGHQLMEEEES